MDEIYDELFSKRLSELIDSSNYILSDMEEIVGKKSATISRYASGEIKGVKRSTIVKLANFFGVNAAWLAGLSDEKYISNVNSKQLFPLLGTVKAGYNYLAQENWIGYVNLDKEVSDPENYFALKVTGDSMQPIMYEDDIVIVHKQNNVESGQIAIVIVDGEEATVKKLIKYDDHIELVAFNSYYPPRKLTKNDNFKVIGKVTEARIRKIFE